MPALTVDVSSASFTVHLEHQESTHKVHLSDVEAERKKVGFDDLYETVEEVDIYSANSNKFYKVRSLQDNTNCFAKFVEYEREHQSQVLTEVSIHSQLQHPNVVTMQNYFIRRSDD